MPEDFREHVRSLLASRLPPRAPGAPVVVMGAGHDDLETGRRYIATLAELRMSAPRWPREHGGFGATAEEATVIAEERERFASADLYPFMVGIGVAGPTIIDFGEPSQQERWLPGIRTGAEIWCQLFSEPDAGSDLANLGTRADRDGDVWRVTGQKVWSSRAHYADWGFLLARSDPDAPKHAGITAFGVRMRTPGVTVRPLRQMNGDDHFSEVFLDDVLVDDADRIGAVGSGWKVAVGALAHERGSIGGGWGMVSPEDVIALAHRARASAAVRDRVAGVVAEMEVSRLANIRARALAQAGRPGPEGSGAKLRGSLTTRLVSQLAIDLAGLAAIARDERGAESGQGDEWQTLFLTGPSFGIRGGTDEIQRNIVGERVLGLPPEPRADKDVPWRRQR
ncbi:MAG TPA: acyl-CoA dehydrogenase family protein [Acidimicrobiales bacterium]|nr:acyl-CoA dehydrogenase family protein [Acidimicrobiales bacterium]